MLVLSFGIVLTARVRKFSLSVRPKHFAAVYLAATVLSAALLFVTPRITHSTD